MQQHSAPKTFRWWTPVLLVVLPAAAAAFLWMRETPFIEFIFVALGLLSVLLLTVWFTFWSEFPKRTRWALGGSTLGMLALAALAIGLLTRMEGSIGGSGLPRLVWKWSPKLEGTTNAVVVDSAALAGTNVTAEAADIAADFPQFLGPDRSGIIRSVGLATDWDHLPPVQIWMQPIGLGWSAFAVAGRQALTQEQRRDDELVVCYDVHTGKALWAHTNRTRFSEPMGGDGPRATPTIQSNTVFAMGASGILDCLDRATGRLIWSRNVLQEHQLSNVIWGKSCSPLLVDEFVVVTGGAQREKSLLAYEAATGKPAWHACRDAASYASPVLATVAGVRQILSVNAHSVTGHDPRNGNILWEFAWPAEFAKVTQPIVVDTNRVLIAAGYGVGCVMLNLLRDDAGSWSVEPLWKSRSLKPKFTNLIRKGDYVYGLDDGTLVCIDLASGQRQWKEGRYGHGQILLVNDLLLVQAESGYVALVEITPERPKELTRFQALTGKTWNNPVVAGEFLLVRNDKQAACYRLPMAGTAQAATPADFSSTQKRLPAPSCD